MVKLKLQNPLLSYVHKGERKYTVFTTQCRVHFIIIIIFNLGKVLICVIYQLNFAVRMYVTLISCYITLYVPYSIIRGFT